MLEFFSNRAREQSAKMSLKSGECALKKLHGLFAASRLRILENDGHELACHVR